MSKFSNKKPQPKVGRKMPQSAVAYPLMVLSHVSKDLVGNSYSSNNYPLPSHLVEPLTKFSELFNECRCSKNFTTAVLNSKEIDCKFIQQNDKKMMVVTSAFLMEISQQTLLAIKTRHISDGHKADLAQNAILKVGDVLIALHESGQKAFQVTSCSKIMKFYSEGMSGYSSYRVHEHQRATADLIPWLSRRYEPKSFRALARRMYKTQWSDAQWQAWKLKEDYFRTNVPLNVAFAELTVVAQTLN